MSLNKVTKTLALPITFVKDAAFEPLITGPLLFALTRAPEHVRQALLRPFATNVLSKNGPQRLLKFITTLKYLFALGIASRLNQFLNRLALNHWYLTRQGAPWKFGGDGQTELVVVTGGCSGFGYHFVKSLAEKSRVVVLDISDMPEELSKLPGVHYYKCDVTDFGAITSVAGSIRNRHGNPTVLINNAGIASPHAILDTTPEWLDKLFKVNLISHWALIREFLPPMLEAKKGHIVTIASAASYIPAGSIVDYCATKAGALALHEGLRTELRDKYTNGECIETTVVHPMWARTGIVKDFEAKLEKRGQYLMPATDVTDVVVKQILSGRSGHIYVPKQSVMLSGMRGWPQWLAELVRGDIRRNKDKPAY